MKNIVLNVLILFTFISCSGGGGGDGEDSTSIEFLPSGTVISISEFKKLIENYNPFIGMSFTFRGEFSFNKENKTCSGTIDSTVSTTSITSNVVGSGYCTGKNTKKEISASSLQFLNVDNIIEALGEDLVAEELGSNKYRLSFKNQKNWSRSYTFKVAEGTIVFPVTLRFNYKDQFQKLNWKININKGLENSSANSSAATDATDLAEAGIYSIF
ncbi:MAG: hypothetical protein DRQ89_12010 [Epsilonproteobacteria bacterium]|nr:MAG: hypothetical protein DRQ89_12010 [Campylobacterota bacterium]